MNPPAQQTTNPDGQAPPPPPRILAPAGNRAAFLAAVAAGADAIYCGLKRFSARMEAKNFSVEELTALAALARRHGTAVYVAVNSLLKPEDLVPTGRLLAQLTRSVAPEALIIQDPAVIELARQTGFAGELHLSTLANAGFPEALSWLRRPLGVHQVVLPRELDADELRAMAAACPPDLGLELFVHGALCYGVSGRCYWSSYLGGKSGLRGRCVQPCRRLYRQGGAPRRLFACLDLSLDVLAKVVRQIPAIRAWKIEGRKKGPHYVYYTVAAYRLLRDEGGDPQAKRDAQDLLAQALGRPGTHYRFIAHRPSNPIQPGQPSGSGMLLGAVKGAGRGAYVQPREALLPGDQLRVGTEDEPGHALVRINRGVPARGRYILPAGRGRPLAPGTPVFLTDRLEPALAAQVAALEAEVGPAPAVPEGVFTPAGGGPPRRSAPGRATLLTVQRHSGPRRGAGSMGRWVAESTPERLRRREAAETWWWLPPVSWPRDAAELGARLERLRSAGARRFVVNAPWQAALLGAPRGLETWAGPFCNVANPMAVAVLARCGFAGVIVSPELGREDFLALAQGSPLPLGAVIGGSWPLCISRVLAEEAAIDQPFESPRGEEAWVARYGEDYWVFPNWRLDLAPAVETLRRAGYRLFVHLEEPVPAGVRMKARPGLWNWETGLK